MIDMSPGEDDFIKVREELMSLNTQNWPCENCKEVIAVGRLILREVQDSREMEKVVFSDTFFLLRAISEITINKITQ